VAHDQLRDIDDDGVRYQREDGEASAGTPGEQAFWVASASGSGTQTVTWRPRSGEWALVIARADGSPGVRAKVDVGAKAPSLVGLGVGLLIGGLLLIALGIALVVLGAIGLGRRLSGPPGSSGQPAAPTPGPVAPQAPENRPTGAPTGQQ